MALGFWRALVLVLWRHTPQKGTKFFLVPLRLKLGPSFHLLFVPFSLAAESDQVGSDAMEQDLEANLEPTSCCVFGWTEWRGGDILSGVGSKILG